MNYYNLPFELIREIMIEQCFSICHMHCYIQNYEARMFECEEPEWRETLARWRKYLADGVIKRHIHTN